MHKAILRYSDTLAAQVINAKNVAVFDTSPETIEHLRKLREHIYGPKPEATESPKTAKVADVDFQAQTESD